MTKRWFVYDGAKIAAQFQATGAATPTMTHRYFWGLGVDELLAQDDVATGETLWALTDHLGSVRDPVDSAGTVRKHASYDTFGNVQGEQFFDASGNELSASDSNAADTLFGYTGRPYDAETDLQNNLHRWYDSETGRWISQDPIGFAAGDGNLYRYVGNGSTGAVDPDGLQARSSPDRPEQQPNKTPLPGVLEGEYLANPGTKDELLRRVPRATPHVISESQPSYARRNFVVGAQVGHYIVIPGSQIFLGDLVGTAAAQPCIGLIIRTKEGPKSRIYVFHFTATQNPMATLQRLPIPAGSQAVILGGDNARSSNVTLKLVLKKLRAMGIKPSYADITGAYVDCNGKEYRFSSDTPPPDLEGE